MAGTANKLVNNVKLETGSSILRALAHPLRMKIIAFIDANREINVNKIYKTLKVEQSIASQHLRILRDDKLVLTKRTGKFIFYTVNYDKMGTVEGALQNFLNA